MTRNAPARFRWRAFVTLVFARLFVLAGAFHLWFNWRTFWFYVRSKFAEGLLARRELTLADLPPFGSLVDLGERAKESWSAGGGEPPVPHAELGIPFEEGLARLRARGIEASGETPMRALAERHGQRPHDLVRILAGA